MRYSDAQATCTNSVYSASVGTRLIRPSDPSVTLKDSGPGKRLGGLRRPLRDSTTTRPCGGVTGWTRTRWLGPSGSAASAALSELPVARGKQGELWRLDTDEGAWAVKVAFDPEVEKDHETFAAFQEAAARSRRPRPGGAPHPGRRGLRRRRRHRSPGVRLGRPARPRHPRRPCGGRDDPGPPAPGPVPRRGERDAWFEEPLGAEAWDALVADLSAAGAPFAARLARAAGRPRRGRGLDHAAHDDADVPPRPLGRQPAADRGRGPLRHRLGGLRRPPIPAASSPARCSSSARNDAGRARSLHDAYVAAGGPGRVEERADFSMLVAQLGHITRQAASDWLTPNRRTPDRAAAEAWVAETLDDPHTPELLDALLAAVRSRTPLVLAALSSEQEVGADEAGNAVRAATTSSAGSCGGSGRPRRRRPCRRRRRRRASRSAHPGGPPRS